MFDSVKNFLTEIGWDYWFAAFFSDSGEVLANVTFGQFVLNTIPAIMQLCLVVWLLNWILGIISDGCNLRFGGGRKMF